MKFCFSIVSSILIAVLVSGCDQHESKKSEAVATPAIAKPTLSANGITYIGKHNSDKKVDSFLGLPFAQAPVGALRWMPPVALSIELSASEGLVEAKEYAPSCMQGPHLLNWYKGVISSFGGDPDSFPSVEVSEDCLYLNVWRPSPTEKQKALPVLVFIHGGSNKGGWSYEPNYIGEEMAKRGIIVVSIAYRLGVFGFFSHPDLEHANFALLDELTALQWIQDNIAAAGGDPNRVTIAGESAGASNISYLMASPLAKGLFQRAIHQSGGWAMRGIRGKGDNAALGTKLAHTILGKDGATLAALRDAPAEKVLAAAYEVYQDHFFDPVVDGHSITRSVPDAAADGQLAKVDLMIGSNANEARMYLDKAQSVDDWISENSSDTKIKELLDPSASRIEQLDQLSTAYSYACPSHQLATVNADNGGRSWVYYFSRVREGQLAAEMGAYHGAELPYVFNTHDDWLPTNNDDHKTTETVMNYWAQFVRTGDPNSAGMPAWPAYQQHGDLVQNLNTTVKSERHISQALCQYLMP